MMSAKLKTAIVGATGYSGAELTRLLLHHSQVDTPVLLRRESEREISEVGGTLADEFPAFSGNGGYPLQSLSWPALKKQKVDLMFLATPHEVSRMLAPRALAEGFRVIDLSGAWR